MRSSRDSTVTRQQRAGSGWRLRKEAGSGTEVDRSGGSPLSEEDSGILDVEDEDDYEVGDHDVSLCREILYYFRYYWRHCITFSFPISLLKPWVSVKL